MRYNKKHPTQAGLQLQVRLGQWRWASRDTVVDLVLMFLAQCALSVSLFLWLSIADLHTIDVGLWALQRAAGVPELLHGQHLFAIVPLLFLTVLWLLALPAGVWLALKVGFVPALEAIQARSGAGNVFALGSPFAAGTLVMLYLALDHPRCCGFNDPPEHGPIWAMVPLSAGLVIQLLVQLLFRAGCRVPLPADSTSVIGWASDSASEADQMLRRAVVPGWQIVRTFLNVALVIAAQSLLLLKANGLVPISWTLASVPLLVLCGLLIIPIAARACAAALCVPAPHPARPTMAFSAMPVSNPLKDVVVFVDAAVVAAVSILVTVRLDIPAFVMWPAVLLVPAYTPGVVATLLLLMAAAAGLTMLLRRKPVEPVTIQGTGAPLTQGLQWLEPVEWGDAGDVEQGAAQVRVTWACPQHGDEGGTCNLFTVETAPLPEEWRRSEDAARVMDVERLEWREAYRGPVRLRPALPRPRTPALSALPGRRLPQRASPRRRSDRPAVGRVRAGKTQLFNLTGGGRVGGGERGPGGQRGRRAHHGGAGRGRGGDQGVQGRQVLGARAHPRDPARPPRPPGQPRRHWSHFLRPAPRRRALAAPRRRGGLPARLVGPAAVSARGRQPRPARTPQLGDLGAPRRPRAAPAPLAAALRPRRPRPLPNGLRHRGHGRWARRGAGIAAARDAHAAGAGRP
jgi:hypothetical protein